MARSEQVGVDKPVSGRNELETESNTANAVASEPDIAEVELGIAEVVLGIAEFEVEVEVVEIDFEAAGAEAGIFGIAERFVPQPTGTDRHPKELPAV